MYIFVISHGNILIPVLFLFKIYVELAVYIFLLYYVATVLSLYGDRNIL